MADYVSDSDLTWADTWLGGLTGSAARRDAAYNQYQQRQAINAWRELGESAPTAEDLTPQYGTEGTEDEYGDMLGGPSQLQGFGASSDQTQALEALRRMYTDGGYTDESRNLASAMQAQNAQQVGGMNRAALSQMEARGMGGSGAALAAQMGGSQSLANANAQSDAAIHQAAQMRALQALQGYGQMSTTMQGQEFARRQALDAYNQQNMDWRRGRESRNTGTQNAQQDAAASARQQAWSNQASTVSGLTGQYQASQDNRRADGERTDAATDRLLNTAGTVVGAAACCHPTTPILTPDGERPIAELRAGDIVYTLERGERVARPLARVSSQLAPKGHHVVRVTLASGRVLEVSAPHPTVDGRLFGDMQPGDDLGGQRITSVERVPYQAPATFDILPASDSGAYLAAGAWIGSTLFAARSEAA
jgi:hypothetical protein